MTTENRDMDFVNEEQLTQIFADIGKEYGYDSVSAKYTVYKDVKVRWQRSFKWASFEVSDYLQDAPGEVIEGMARTLFGSLEKKDVPYSEAAIAWFTSKDFAKRNQPAYLRRSPGLTKSPVGKIRNLNNSMARLINAGLAEEDPDLILTWMKDRNIRKVGSCSVLMKVIAISPIFDSMDIPEFVLDYVVYHEYLHATKGRESFPRDRNIGAEVTRFPTQGEAEDWLNRLSLYA